VRNLHLFSKDRIRFADSDDESFQESVVVPGSEWIQNLSTAAIATEG